MLALLAIGLTGGLLGGLLGVGGGFIMIPLMVMYTPLTQKQAQATSLAAIVPIAIVGAVLYYTASRHPQVDLRFAVLLVIGTVAGAYVGARVMSRLPERLLKQIFAVLLVLIGIKELVLP